MAIFTEHERNILKKFINDGYVETEEEHEIIDKQCLIGFVSTGFDWDKMCATAKLTDSCIVHLNR